MALGPLQVVLIIAVIILLFGAGRLATVGKGLGEGIRNFKKGLSGDDEHKKLPEDSGSSAD